MTARHSEEYGVLSVSVAGWPGGGLVVSEAGATAGLQAGSARRIPLPDASVQCVVTSPPYWGLRSYAGEQDDAWGGDPTHAHEWGAPILGRTQSGGLGGSKLEGAPPGPERRPTWESAYCACGAWRGALGLEPTPEMYVEHLVEVFREVARVLRPDGTVWLNLGDSYNNRAVSRQSSHQGGLGFTSDDLSKSWAEQSANGRVRMSLTSGGLKEKDLVGIPWMVAFALRADGWYLRSDIVWAKPNPMPESVRDRPTKSHEYVFLLTRGERYHYDVDAIREPSADPKGSAARYRQPFAGAPEGAVIVPGDPKGQRTRPEGTREFDGGRNARSVWTINTQPYKHAHFATFPEALAERALLAGTSPVACGTCGQPHRRVVERGEPVLQAWSDKGAGQYDDALGGMRRTSLEQGSSLKHVVPRRTVGFESACGHDDPTGRCLVLDPFMGSGTVGQVALRHGRDFAGVDTSSEYLALALHPGRPLSRLPRDPRRRAGVREGPVTRVLESATGRGPEWHGDAYRDAGCEVWETCLTCPLPRCRFDLPDAGRDLVPPGRNWLDDLRALALTLDRARWYPVDTQART